MKKWVYLSVTVLLSLSFFTAEANSCDEILSYRRAVKRLNNWKKKGKINPIVHERCLANLVQPLQKRSSCLSIAPLLIKGASAGYVCLKAASFSLRESSIIAGLLYGNDTLDETKRLGEQLSIDRRNMVPLAACIAIACVFLPNTLDSLLPVATEVSKAPLKYRLTRVTNNQVIIHYIK